MKPKALRTYTIDINNVNTVTIKARTRIAREPDIDVKGVGAHDEYGYRMWFSRDWVGCFYDPTDPVVDNYELHHLMECPRTGKLLMSAITHGEYDKDKNHNAWEYAEEKTQSAYREWMATYELEKAFELGEE